MRKTYFTSIYTNNKVNQLEAMNSKRKRGRNEEKKTKTTGKKLNSLRRETENENIRRLTRSVLKHVLFMLWILAEKL